MDLMRLPLPAALLMFFVGSLLPGCSRDDFAKERRAESAGFRVRYAASEKWLMIQRPDGTEEGVHVPELGRVFLHRMPARESTDNKAHYRWMFQGRGAATQFVPVFAVEPREITSILREELPGFDEAAALEMTRRFMANEATFCSIWQSDEFLRESSAKRETGCKP